jgi:RNA polymerase sigma-70 factor (ECF subfamily)
MDAERAIALLMRERDGVLAYVRAILGMSGPAEDVIQDLAVIVLHKHGDIPDEAGFAGWIRRAARFEALNRWRAIRRDLPLDESALDALDRAWEEAGEDPRVDLLRQCLAGLGPKARELLDLRYRDGLSGEELALQFDKPLNTIYVTLTRLHSRLGECVKRRRSSRVST